MKRCSKCKVEQDESGFCRSKRSRDGLYPQCKMCVKVYQTANREVIAEYQKAYYDNNREAAAGYRKTHYEANREAVLEHKKVYYKNNREVIDEYQKVYREANREALLERHNAYVKKRLTTDAEYRCRILAAMGVRNALSRGGHTKGGRTFEHLPYTPVEMLAHLLSTLQNGHTEADFLSGALHVDHIWPHSLTPYDSLLHPNFQRAWALSNLRLISAEHNLAKGNKIEMLDSDGNYYFVEYDEEIHGQ